MIFTDTVTRDVSVLVPSSLLVALAPQVAALAAAIASLRGLRAVLGDVTGAVAFVARHVGRAALIDRLWAVADPVSGLVAPVAGRIIGLGAVLGDVANTVAAVAALGLLGAGTCKVPELVAFVALFAVATHAAAIAAHTAAPTAAANAARSTAAETAFPGKVARPVALVARGRHRHLALKLDLNLVS